MTLIVTLVSDSLSVMVADRRVTTPSGTVVSDEFNKVTVFFCRDARLSVAFTGVATLGTFNASEWLAETLRDITADQLDVHSIVEELRIRAGRMLSMLTGEDRRLCMVLSGFVYCAGTAEPRIYVISNFANEPHNAGIFSVSTIAARGESFVELAGQNAAFQDSTIQTLRSLLDASLPPPQLVRCAVRHLQKAATSIRSLNRIGECCTAVIIRSAIDTPVITTYHTSRNARRAYTPNVVVAQTLTSLGSEVMTASILAGPEIRKRDLCWCGSGERFKHCHLRKYGGIYVRHSAWRQPLVPTIACRREDAWPSGQIFAVQGGYE